MVHFFVPARAFSLFLLILLIPACGGKSASAPPAPTVSSILPTFNSSVKVASGSISAAAGGTIAWPANGDIPDGSLTIPAGAIASDTVIDVFQAVPSSNALAGTPLLKIEPSGLVFNLPATLLIGYSENWIVSQGLDETQLFGFSSMDLPQEVEGKNLLALDTVANQATFSILHLSLFWLSPGVNLLGTVTGMIFSLLWQAPDIVDKFGNPVGPEHPFWTGPKRLLIVHGIMSSPSRFYPAIGNLTGGLEPLYGEDAVAYYQYPWGRSIAQNATDLRTLFQLRSTSTFQCDIVAHSMGGLVVRSAMEQLGGLPGTKAFVTLGTPHEGSNLGASLLENLAILIFGSSGTSDGSVAISGSGAFQGILDLLPNSDFLTQINALRSDTSPFITCVVADDDLIVPNNVSESGSAVLGTYHTEYLVDTPGTIAAHSMIHEAGMSVLTVSPPTGVSVLEVVTFAFDLWTWPTPMVQYLPVGIVGTPYSYQLTARAGVPPYQWSSGVVLPQGFNLSSDGVLSGTPNQAMEGLVINFNLVDALGVFFGSGFIMDVINPGELMILENLLPPAAVGTPYAASVSASGGTPPYTWLQVGNGFQVAADGSVSGSPDSGTVDLGPSSSAFPTTLNLGVVDSSSDTRIQGATVWAAATMVKIESTTFRSASLTLPYSFSLKCSGGIPPYSWNVLSGSLPNGLTLQSNGLVAGTPVVSGTFAFTLQLQDSVGLSISKGMSIDVQ